MRPLFRKPTTGGAAEFYLRHPENLLLVKQERDGGILVSTTADNLTVEQREAFVSYLSAEGFICDSVERSEWLQQQLPDQERRQVRWIVDPTWPEIDPVYAKHVQRLCWYTAGTMMAWLALMAALVCC